MKLLRAIQEGKIRRIGDNRLIPVDFRLIAATHKKLEQAIKDGTFREDLYFRINVVSLEVPTLRERKSDIPLLADYFLRQKLAQHGKSEAIFGFQEEAINFLMNQPWPGNVRELEYLIERAVLFDEDGWLSIEDIKNQLQTSSPKTANLSDLLDNYEKHLILDALDQSNWIRTQAANLLGVHEATLRSKMKRLGISDKHS